MGLFSFFTKLTKKLTKSRLPTSQLTWMYHRVCYYLPELDEETALILAAKLYMQSHRTTNKLKVVDLVIAYQLGTFGYCGITLKQAKRHDHELNQDQTSRLVRWVMQMEFLLLRAELKLAPPSVIADIVIQSKAAIRRDVEETMGGDPANHAVRSPHDQLIQQFERSPTYLTELENIRYAIEQVQSDTDKDRE